MKQFSVQGNPPDVPRTDREIEILLSTPTAGAIDAASALPGDFMVLGVGGKMGTPRILNTGCGDTSASSQSEYRE